MRVLLPERRCYVIRSMRLGRLPTFFRAHESWDSSPLYATIFQDYDAAIEEVVRARCIGAVAAAEVLDVVPLAAAVKLWSARQN